MKKFISILLTIACTFSLAACNATVEKEEEETTSVTNPHEASWLDDTMVETLNTIKRVDDNGAFYEMNYTADYYSATVQAVVNAAVNQLSSGCSAFTTYNTDEDFLLCRNYDYRHKDANGDSTGLNVVVYTAAEGKLKTIGVCDAYWLNTSAYYAGALDDGTTDTSNLILAPYMCVDIMNEAGLAGSLLVTDVKEGESITNQNTGKTRIPHSILLRYIMDEAKNIDEAIEIAKSYDIFSTGGTDLHIFLTQKDGTSAVLEWRNQELYVTYTNAVANFYVGFDDGEDAYKDDGTLKETCVRITPTINNYKYGYGHGYHRFNQIISTLERYIQSDANSKGIRNSIMEESEALDTLKVAAQGPGIENTSFTQYSAIYNLNDLSVSFYVHRNYEKAYTFTLK